MLKRLFAALFFAVAVSVAQPAQASALSVDAVDCVISVAPYTSPYTCTAVVSGGTGIYVSYAWTIGSTRPDSYYTTTTDINAISRECWSGYAIHEAEYFSVEVIVTDSAGTKALGSSLTLICA